MKATTMKYARILVLCMPLLFAGCKDDDDPTSGTESLVEVIPSGSGMPAGTVYYFYEKEAEAPATYDAATDGTFSAKMAFGTYAMLGANTNATDVTFDGMGDFSSATVSATKQEVEASRAGGGYLNQVGEVYAVSVESLTVEKDKTAKLTPTPQLLTKNITINFDVDVDYLNNISRIAAEVNGIHSSVYLATGQPTDEAVANCRVTVIAFDANAVTRAGVNMQGSAKVLGIQKPSEALPDYTPRLRIYVELKDNTYYWETIDLTETLATGDLSQPTIELPLITIEGNGIGFTAEIGEWATPDPSELDPDNNTNVKI